MGKESQPFPRVLVVLPSAQKACRDKMAGILRYSYLHGPWDVQTLGDNLNISQLHAFNVWQPDGIILGDPADESLLRILRRRIPVVQLDVSVSPRYPTIWHDSRLIAEAAADHLLQLGLPHFAFIGSVPTATTSPWAQTRAEAFAARLAAAGHSCHRYAPVHPEDWGLEQRHIKAWLLGLPKPCGIMAVHDPHAKQVLDICLTVGLRVPDEIAIVGVDNDLLVCENTTPTLSSVFPDFEGSGYLAAETLDKLLHGAKDVPRQVFYGIKGVVLRQSSLCVGPASRLIASAVEFIRRNACSGIGVPDVVAHCKASRRHIENHFRTALRHSILDEIQRHRLEHICTLLRETSRPIGEIGESCGYNSDTYLKALFKCRFGMTMRDYRKAILHPPP